MRAGQDLAELDLHRPFVDDVTIACEECGGRARRVEPVLDAWFDSGSMPAAQWHHPFENADVFERRFPADFICEAIDQTRGWFYSLLAVNTLVFGRSPYRNVVCLVAPARPGRAEDVEEPRQRDGPVGGHPRPRRRRGALELRVRELAVDAQARLPREHRRDHEPVPRHALEHLLVLRHLREPRRLDAAAPARARAPTHVMDRWVRSRLHSTVREVTEAFEDFDALRATQALDAFVDDLSNWYVRRSRPRFWKAADGAAHAVLHECLRTRRAAPRAGVPVRRRRAVPEPRRAPTSRSTSPTGPASTPTAIDPALEAEMALARELVSLGLKARTESKLRVRQPLLARDRCSSRATRRSPTTVAAEIADALNVKRIETVTSLAGLLDYTVLPNFRALGPKVGKRLPRVKELLAAVDGAAVQAAIDADGRYVLDVDGDPITLTADEVQIRASSHEELALAQEGALAVALDTTPRRRAAPRGPRARGRAGAQRPAQGAGLRDRRPHPRRARRRRRPRARRSSSTATGSPVRCWRWSSTLGIDGRRRRGRAGRSTDDRCGCRV